MSPAKIYEAVNELRIKQEAIEARLPKIPFKQITSNSPKRTIPNSKLMLSPFNSSVDNNRRFDFSSIRLEPLKKIWRRNKIVSKSLNFNKKGTTLKPQGMTLNQENSEEDLVVQMQTSYSPKQTITL